MERYATGDEAAFADVYDAVAPRLHGYLQRRTRDRARADDIVQSTLLHMHRARGSFIAGSRVLPWAFAIARRLLIDELRRTRRDATAMAVPVEDDMSATAGDSAMAPFEAEELALVMDGELSRLPKSQQMAFELVRLDGLSHAQAAEVLGVTVSSVKLRVHRAHSALKRVLAAL
jgi:RNA polymerase sigma-70 factor (ECF subfamily)